MIMGRKHFALFQHSRNLVVATLALLVFQQVIVASSTWWLTSLIKGIANGSENIISYFFLYLGSMIIPYFPGSLSLIYLARLKASVSKTYSELFLKKQSNNPALWSDQNEKKRRTPIIASEAYPVIDSACEHFYSLVAIALNLTLNTLVIGFLVDRGFILGYLVSFAISYVVLKSSLSRQKKMAQDAQDARVGLSGHMVNFWDNIVLGNSLNQETWTRTFRELFRHFAGNSVAVSSFQQKLSLRVALITFIPCGVVATAGMIQHSNDLIYLGSLVVILPRLFMTLNLTHDFLLLLLQTSEHRQKIEGLFSSLQSSKNEIDSRINWKLLDFEYYEDYRWRKIRLKSLSDVAEFCEATPKRLRISGPNGSGKSSLLLLLKSRLGRKSHYLPAQNSLQYNADLSKQSTGEKLLLILDELTSVSGAGDKILLLDEWSANLDHCNYDKIDNLLSSFSTNQSLVEVLHSHSRTTS